MFKVIESLHGGASLSFQTCNCNAFTLSGRGCLALTCSQTEQYTVHITLQMEVTFIIHVLCSSMAHYYGCNGGSYVYVRL